MAKNPFAAMKTANKAQARILRRDTASDFRVTQSGLDSIINNLLTGQKGLASSLTASNARGLAAMGRIAKRGDARLDQVGDVGRNIVRNRYGSAIAANPELFRTTDRVASSQEKVSRATVKGGALSAKGANQAMDILQEAGATAANSAQYELATALRERQSLDAETIAASKLQLQQMRLQSKLEWQNFKKMQDYEMKKAEKAEGKGAAATIALVSQTAPEASQFISQFMATHENASPAEAVAAYAQEYGVTDPGTVSMAQRIAANIRSGMGAVEAAQTAVSTLYGDIKGFDLASMNETLQAGVRAGNTTAITSLQEKAEAGTLTEQEAAYAAWLLRQRGADKAASEILQGVQSGNGPAGYVTSILKYMPLLYGGTPTEGI